MVVADSEVSGRHASFVLVDGGVVVEDLGSTNGTFVNGQRVSGSQRLAAGDRVQLGNTVLEVRGLAPPAVSAQPLVEGLQPTRVRQIPTLPVLVLVAGQQAGTELPVGGQVVVGRDPGVADVVLDGDTEISRRHASFAAAGAGLTVQDLGSTNGTFVNGQRLAQDAVTLGNGDRVELGETVIEIRLAGEAVAEPAPMPAATPTPAATPGAPANDIVVEGLVKEFGDHRAVDGVEPVRQSGRDLRVPRAERGRQVDHGPHAHHAAAADVGHRPRRGVRRHHAGPTGAGLDRRRPPGGCARSAISTPGSTWTSRRRFRDCPGPSAGRAARS